MPEFIISAIAFFFFWLFCVAGIQKLRAIAWFANLIGRYFDRGAVPHMMVVLVAAAELLCCALLILPASRGVGLLLACLLLLGYALVMILQMQRGRADMNCGCAGPASDTSISAGLVYRNLICAMLAGVAAYSVSAPGAGDVGIWSIGMVLTTVLLTFFLVLIYVSFEQLIANSQRYAGAF
ncbi:MAG: putative membrane protein YphA (DoxX/SURF4 family) [Halieaceae bacterium]|jgi:uncharacterized membrane protein YphA (DoxX/SURF4 family)